MQWSVRQHHSSGQWLSSCWRLLRFLCISNPQTVLTVLWLFLICVSSTDVKPQEEKYLPDFSIYHNITQIEKDLKELCAQHPNFMKIDYSFKSLQGRPQLLLRVRNFTDDAEFYMYRDQKIPKIKLLLSYGEHAREFLPIESMFYLLHNLTEGLQTTGTAAQAFSKKILNRFDIYIVTLANPDGRQLVERSRNFCWRGTSSGVDLNRNFDWEFANKGSSSDPEDEEYRGKHPFSEPECKIFTELTQKTVMDAFISFHSGIRHIYLPFADTVSKRHGRKPNNFEGMLELARTLARATTHTFNYGNAYDLNSYTADGTSFDYMAGVRNIPFSLAVEMWGNDKHKGSSCFDLFNPHSSELQKEVADLHPLYVALFMYLNQWKEKHAIHLMDVELDPPPMTLGYILLAVVLLLFLCVAAQGKYFSFSRLVLRRRVVSLRALSSTLSFWNMKST